MHSVPLTKVKTLDLTWNDITEISSEFGNELQAMDHLDLSFYNIHHFDL